MMPNGRERTLDWVAIRRREGRDRETEERQKKLKRDRRNTKIRQSRIDCISRLR